jgi:uncharacterized lipoprotein YajG
MKRLALAAAVVLFAACAPKAEEAKPAADAMATPAAPTTDTASMATMDTTKKDTTAMKADTTKH